jgi:SAM-dependent methyltransferase
MTSWTCPACGGTVLAPRFSPRQIGKEIELRESFVRERFDYRPEPAELMDLTEFMHGGMGRLLACARCGLTVRDEATRAHYEDDLYDLELLDHLYPRYRKAFQRKETQYRPLLPPRADVVEIASHLGAFLETAEEWDWRPTGLDIGEYTTRFARSRGLTVQRKPVEDFRLRLGRADAVFLWNCFEQLEDPASTLREAHRLLKPNGLVIVRVPNVAYYQHWRRKLWQGHFHEALEKLGYNNLLGFPYLYGYTPEALSRILRRNGFQPLQKFGSSLIVTPFPDPKPQVRAEWRSVRQVAGPWIEMVGQA